MIKCRTLDRWDDIYGETSRITIGINGNKIVEVDCIWEDVDKYETSFEPNYLTDEECEAVEKWIDEQFEVERMMDDGYFESDL